MLVDAVARAGRKIGFVVELQAVAGLKAHVKRIKAQFAARAHAAEAQFIAVIGHIAVLPAHISAVAGFAARRIKHAVVLPFVAAVFRRSGAKDAGRHAQLRRARFAVALAQIIVIGIVRRQGGQFGGGAFPIAVGHQNIAAVAARPALTFGRQQQHGFVEPIFGLIVAAVPISQFATQNHRPRVARMLGEPFIHQRNGVFHVAVPGIEARLPEILALVIRIVDLRGVGKIRPLTVGAEGVELRLRAVKLPHIGLRLHQFFHKLRVYPAALRKLLLLLRLKNLERFARAAFHHQCPCIRVFHIFRLHRTFGGELPVIVQSLLAFSYCYRREHAVAQRARVQIAAGCALFHQ